MSFLLEMVFQVCVEGVAWFVERRFGATGCLTLIGGIVLIALFIWNIS